MIVLKTDFNKVVNGSARLSDDALALGQPLIIGQEILLRDFEGEVEQAAWILFYDKQRGLVYSCSSPPGTDIWNTMVSDYV